MAARLLTTFKQKIKSLQLIPASGGCFEIEFGGDLVYSKLATGRYPNEVDIEELLRTRLSSP